ncbi:MAG TPA: hypothetical protein VLR49_12105 [Ferruginibacter sp.]|nr:hypothetical protein [Ferruginibacter sp.]
MKKYFLVAALLFHYSLNAQQPVKGKMKIYFHSIRCNKETLDDFFEGDGKGDEVFVTLFYSIASSNGTTKYSNKITTSIYGDKRIWPARVKAGTAGTTGGIKASDVVYAHPQTEANMPIGDERFKGLPMIDANLEAGDILTILPVLWEWDSDTKNVQNSLESFLWNSINNINVTMAGHTQKFDMRSYRIFGSQLSSCINLQGITQILQGVNGIAGNRPIGMKQNGSFDPEIFVFNSVIMENWQTIMQPYYQNTANNLSIRYDEIFLGNTRDHGQYNLLFYPEFIKTATSVNPGNGNTNTAIKPVINTGTIKNFGNKINMPVKGTITPPPYSMTNEMMYGQWKGTLSVNDGSKPGPFLFKINNGVFWLQDSNGNSIASGGFKIENNNFSSVYSYPSGDSYTIISALYNSSTGELTGTWFGNGINAAKKGSWKVVKQSN